MQHNCIAVLLQSIVLFFLEVFMYSVLMLYKFVIELCMYHVELLFYSAVLCCIICCAGIYFWVVIMVSGFVGVLCICCFFVVLSWCAYVLYSCCVIVIWCCVVFISRVLSVCFKHAQTKFSHNTTTTDQISSCSEKLHLQQAPHYLLLLMLKTTECIVAAAQCLWIEVQYHTVTLGSRLLLHHY